MVNESANFYGIMLLLLMFITLIGIFISEPPTSAFVVKEVKEESSFFEVKTFPGDPRLCADGSLNGECSSLIKPKFCLYGTLADYCELCGCDAGEVCQNRECVKVE